MGHPLGTVKIALFSLQVFIDLMATARRFNYAVVEEELIALRCWGEFVADAS
jgi:hypothetical protein